MFVIVNRSYSTLIVWVYLHSNFRGGLQKPSYWEMVWVMAVQGSSRLQETRKASCRWQTRTTLAKRLYGLCKSSGVVSCIVSLPIDSLPMVSYYRPIVTLCLKCTVFEIWRHIVRKSLKNLPHPHLARSFGVTHCEFFDETRITGYQKVYISRSCFRSGRHNTGVTDRRTDTLSQRPR